MTGPTKPHSKFKIAVALLVIELALLIIALVMAEYITAAVVGCVMAITAIAAIDHLPSD